jgi:hypothetical protein
VTAAARDFIDSLVAGDARDSARAPAARHRLEVDPDRSAHGLTTLVLAIVELLRQLMERQALRRMDYGDLSADQLENLGATLMALEEQMARLREQFGLTEEDLNLDLGPLGSLLPRD